MSTAASDVDDKQSKFSSAENEGTVADAEASILNRKSENRREC